MRVGLIGYYNYGNYGDELFKAQLESTAPGAVFEVLDQLKLMTDENYRNWFRREVDVTILGGGDLIIPYGWAEWYFQPILLEKPILVFGVGVPTWGGHDNTAVAKMKDFLNHRNVKFFATRDKESTAWVLEHLNPQIPVQTFADMICAMPLPSVEKPAQKIFTFITREQRPGEIKWANIEALVARARDYGYHVRNLVLGTGITAEQDRTTLATEGTHINWEIVGGEDNETLTRLIGESTVIASMKFHGCVVATMFGIPAIGLSTTDKFTSLFNEIERPDLISHHTHASLPDKLPKFLAPIPRCTIAGLRTSAKAGLTALSNSLACVKAEKTP
jgi:polysaccharide pyruvyl transferase WcaK-like protein